MDVLRKFQRAAMLVHILYHADKAPVYGSWLQKELSSHGYEISYGTLYPWLNELLRLELLTQEEKQVGGRIRKYYSLTRKGKDELAKITPLVEELFSELNKK